MLRCQGTCELMGLIANNRCFMSRGKGDAISGKLAGNSMHAAAAACHYL